jgi:hypothetical protein
LVHAVGVRQGVSATIQDRLTAGSGQPPRGSQGSWCEGPKVRRVRHRSEYPDLPRPVPRAPCRFLAALRVEVLTVASAPTRRSGRAARSLRAQQNAQQAERLAALRMPDSPASRTPPIARRCPLSPNAGNLTRFGTSGTCPADGSRRSARVFWDIRLLWRAPVAVDRARSREVAALERGLPRFTAQPASGARTACLDTRLLGAVRYASATSTSPTRSRAGDEFSTRRPSKVVPPW